MSSQLSVSTLAKLHSHVLKMIDGGVEEAKASIEALRANLKLSDIQTAPDPPLQDEQKLSEYLNVRELIVELFQTLFEVYCYATSVQMAPLRNHIRPYLQDIISEGIVLSTLLRIEQISIQHKSVQTNNQLTIPASRKKNLLSALIQERMALAALLHSIVSFSVPPQAQVNQLLNILSKLEQGDPLTIPLLMASLASLRVSSKNISATVFIGTPARLVADHRHQMLQEYPDDRHELTLSQLQEVHQSLKELTYSQPGMKDVVILALTISEFYLENNGIHIEDVSLHSSVKGAFTSNALPWLITHVLVNVDRPFDCLSLGLDILYRSIPREKTSITYYPLNDRLQEMTTIELQHLTVNIITRLSKLLTHLKTTADVRLEEDKRPLPTLTTSQMDQTVTHYHSTTIPSSSVRSDTEIFSLFITMLFERRPHACRIFWSDEPSVTAFFRFLQTITVSPHRRYQESSLHLVSSLINEPLAAAKAFQVVQNEMLGTITWVALFAGIDYYVKAFKKLAPQPIHNSVISSSEVDLLVSLLRLLRQVCTFDANVRRSILSLANNEVLPLIFDFLTCSIPLRLKAALMEAIASFVSHTSCHLLEHQHISQRIWMFMEIIVIIPQLSLATIGHQKGGLRQELETRESLLQHYPLTIAYLHLLHNLTPPHLAYDEESQASQQHQQQAIGGQLFALVNNLGSPNRPPGVQPYYEYMIQDIFLKAESRNYMNPKELWVQWKWVLSTILNCLIDLDMVSLESDLFITQQYASTNPSLSSYSTSTYSFYRLLSDHPAFFMLSDILEGKPLLDGILLVISKAREAFNESALRQEERATELKSATIVQGNEWPSTNMDSAFISSTDSSNRTITFSSPRDPNLIDPTTYHEYEDAVLFAFRVLHQVLLMQSKFLYEFLPAVAGHTESTTSSSASSKLYVSSKRELDHHLSSRKQAVVDIMFFIQSPNRSVFLDTIGILSIQILTGLSLSSSFIHSRSNINSLVAILSSSELAEPIKTSYSIRMTTSNGEKEPIALYKYDEVQVKSVRLAMLQLLVHNLKLKTIPTIAHMLLGLTKDVHLDLHAPSVASSSLFAEILKLLKGEEPLHILFEEQAQALIYFLLSQPLTFPLSAIMKSMGFFIFAAKRFLDPNRLCFAVPKEFLDTAPFLNVTNVPRHMENRNTLSTPSAGSFSTPRRVRIAPNPIMPPPTNPDLSQETTFAKQMCEKC
ncbi:hypothetical protein HMI55_003629 [Coelomomyces lativittatus]|nr:hypothetical protein HMI55_003629 [Coelomomyces lativittatus]